MHARRLENPDQAFIHVGDKRLKALQRKAWKQGWWPERKKDGIMWMAPDRDEHVTLHRSQSDHRAYDNALGLFRAAGLDA